MVRQSGKKSIPETLSNFDSLPNAANVRVMVVAALYACSVPTVWRMAKDGRIPASRKLSDGVTGWNVGQLRANLADKAES